MNCNNTMDGREDQLLDPRDIIERNIKCDNTMY